MNSNSALCEDTILTMIGPDVLSLAEFGLTLLKLKDDVISELRVENTTIEDVVCWMDNLEAPVFIYDASVFESYLVEQYLIDGDRLILFTEDAA